MEVHNNFDFPGQPLQMLYRALRVINQKTITEIAAVLGLDDDRYCQLEEGAIPGFTEAQREQLYQYYKKGSNPVSHLGAVWHVLYDGLSKQGHGDAIYRHVWDSFLTLRLPQDKGVYG